MTTMNGSITITTPDTKDVKQVQNAMVARAKDLAIKDETTHRAAQELLVQVAKVRKDVVDLFADSKASAYKTHKDICAAEKKLLAPCDTAREEIETKLRGYEAEVRKKTEEAERALEHSRHQEEERGRLAEVAPDLAAALPPVETPNIFVPQMAEVAGVSTRTTWRAEVHNLQALIAWIVLHPEYIDLVEPNMTTLRALANVQKEKFSLPGVRAVEVPITMVRT